MILLIVSSVIHVAVLPYADLVLLSSSSATAILFGILLSVYMLGEKFDFRYDLPGVMLTCAGCITTVAFANTVEQDFTLDSMVSMLLAPKALFYMFGTALSIIASLICITMMTTWLFPFEQAFRASIAGEDLRMRLVADECGFKEESSTVATNLFILG